MWYVQNENKWINENYGGMDRMTGKRFTVHIRWFNYDKTEGDIELKDNGQPILMSESIDDVQRIKTLLNELHEENRLLKIALCEELQDNGNKVYIERFDELFDLNYDEWEQKNEYHDWGIE